jgi:cytochrome bd-type quinol oxidase subunit 1
MGDPLAPATTQAITVEAVSMVLMLFAARRLGKRAA